ncbi:MAG TPA: lipase maturation factor family protein [Verrucomicrobiae bacterium]|nr:lipase maturation factor family protein [Verrucomicrobiae bacterium]
MNAAGQGPITVARPPERPTLLYDRECGFCRRWIRRWRQAVRVGARFEPYQTVAGKYPEIPSDHLARAVHLVRTDGTVISGAHAVFEVLASRPAFGWLRAWYHVFRPFTAASEWLYHAVAANRMAISQIERPFRRWRAAAHGYRRSSVLFLRGLGLIYAIAFASLWVQVDGLAGTRGILPITQMLEAVRAQFGDRGPAIFPTLCWWWNSDAALQAMCIAGVALGIIASVGLCPALCLAILWILYLSLCVAGGVLMNFQWDALLLETGFLAIWLAPLSLHHPLRSRWVPSPTALFLLRWLLFRLMFLSGAVKLLSGDAAWWHLTALDVHYETQPLPNPISWYAHQLPAWFDRICVLVMFLIELGAPFLIFGPRPARRAAGAAIVALMLLIFVTGNYTFFNMLTASLCLTLIDDRALRLFARAPITPRSAHRPTLWPPWVVGPIGALLFLLATQEFTARLALPFRWPPFMERLQDALAPFRSINSYGLFPVMTPTRPEIIIEGSRDAIEWRPYEFRWKPGDPKRAPRFVAPHQPRLDWQMWFAALDDVRHSPWFFRLLGRLIEGSPPVLALLERNPFPEGPPKYIRAELYRYRFTTAAERRNSDEWWHRERLGPYCPVIQLRE